uniref:Uncharacterized protein n=1 Tax=Aegilops tauschii subsp. strangulata TaxID=200361 RepID=A0A453LM22_AEGTS
MLLQFDREAEENIKEKRMRIVIMYLSMAIRKVFSQGRPLLRANMATERHAGKIYTRAMFKQFGHILYKCGAYRVEEIEKGKLYVAIHMYASRREKWCRISYKVTVLNG